MVKPFLGLNDCSCFAFARFPKPYQACVQLVTSLSQALSGLYDLVFKVLSCIGEAYNVIVSYEFIFEPEIQAEAGVKDFILGYTNVSEGVSDATMI